ncbi:MAG: DUF3383 family protein [Patescibacteria group bacterium]|nr:DUF3383 family protein [Patescibacteria group bacterium]
MSSVFPLSTVISISISQAPSLPQVPNINTIAIITQDNIPAGWSAGQAFAIYTYASAVGSDFGLNSNTYAIANAIFSQNPNPVYAGGYVVVIPRLKSPSLETTEAAIQRTSDLVYYLGVVMDEELADSDGTAFASLAAYCQSNDKMLFYASSNANDLNPGSPLDLVRQASDINTRCLYYASPLLNGAAIQQTQIFAGAYGGRGFSVNFNGSKTVLTMALKGLNTIAADGTLTQTQLSAAGSAGVDVYGNLSSVAKVLSSGANLWFDQVYNRFWLKFALQNAAFDLLAGTQTKISMTDAGVGSLVSVLGKVMSQGVNNGFLAPGTWPSGSNVFGNGTDLQRNISDFGFYIYAAPVSSLTAAQIASRQAPIIQIAALEANAVQSAAIIVQITA